MDELDKLLLEDPNFAENFSEVGGREICILITGKTGTGKSTLINGIIGRNVTEVGYKLNPTTSKVAEFNRTTRGVRMRVYDSPGLQDGTNNETAYIQDIVKKCEKVDLVLYTVRMTDNRMNTGDVEAMKKLTVALGEEFWERAIFALTFANEVRDPEDPDNDTSNQIFFEQRLQLWMDKLPETFINDLNITKEVVDSIPVVPAGFYKRPHLPGRRYWFSQFWKAMFICMKEYNEDGYTFLLQFNKDRFKRVYESSDEDLEKKLHEQPIYTQTPRSSRADRIFSCLFILSSVVSTSFLIFAL